MQILPEEPTTLIQDSGDCHSSQGAKVLRKITKSSTKRRDDGQELADTACSGPKDFRDWNDQAQNRKLLFHIFLKHEQNF